MKKSIQNTAIAIIATASIAVGGIVAYGGSDTTYTENNDSFVKKIGENDKIQIQKNRPELRIKRFNDSVDLGVIYTDVSSQGGKNILSKKVEYKSKDIEVAIYPDSETSVEFEIILNKKPKKNIIEFKLENWKDFDFYYQGELSQKEKDEGFQRPENVIGSYAVYLKNSNGINGTGKVGHFYRPKINDSSGKEVWGEMKIKNGILSVSIPQEFLNTAVYPIHKAGGLTFGYTTAGVSSTQIAYSFGTRRYGKYYSMPNNGTLDSIVAYMSGSDTFSAKAFLNQKDSVSSGSHGQIVAITNTGNTSAAGWKTFTAGSQSLTSGTTYILNLVGKKDASITSRLYYDSIDYNGSNSDTYNAFSSDGYTSPQSPWVVSLDDPSTLPVWALSTNYSTDDSSGPSQVVKSGSWPKKLYVCILNHTSSATSEPGVGATWTTYWMDAGNVPVPKFSIYANYTLTEGSSAILNPYDTLLFE